MYIFLLGDSRLGEQVGEVSRYLGPGYLLCTGPRAIIFSVDVVSHT